MSEPMSSGEIEDVLSSIRRLVSDDLRGARPAFATPAPAPVPPAPGQPAPVAKPARLLLTPALRVVDPAPAAAPPPSRPVPQAAAPAAPEPAKPVLFLHRNDAPGHDDHLEAWAADPEPEPAPLPRAQDRVSRIGAATPKAPSWEEDPAPPPLSRLAWTDVAAEEDEPVRFVHRSAPPIGPAPRPRQAQSAPTTLLGTTSEDVLDEALLRDIVREVLREELQGNLGERMTRNIRKLVRAEVQRALIVRDRE